MERFFGAILIAVLIFIGINFSQTPHVLGETATQNSPILEVPQPVTTESRFSEKLEEQTQVIKREIIFKDDPEMEIGEEKVEEEGKDGKITKVIKIIYYTDTSGVGSDSPEVEQGKEYGRELVSSETTPPEDKIVLKGTKIVWRSLDTPDGQISYWRKLRVYATHYDSKCPGCNETTAIGMKAGKGVIAVDPSVIKLRSKVYIPGYGIAIAGDTGGAIKGNIIDLGFDDARTAGWTAHFIDIYLL